MMSLIHRHEILKQLKTISQRSESKSQHLFQELRLVYLFYKPCFENIILAADESPGSMLSESFIPDPGSEKGKAVRGRKKGWKTARERKKERWGEREIERKIDR